MRIKFIDLFAGIGGFRYGLEKNNNKQTYISKKSEQKECTQGRKWDVVKRQIQLCNRYKTTTFRCVWSNEWNKYARQIYKKHWEECDGRDIRTISTKEIPDHDLLCAGFPCQSFSIAGKRGGFDDTRGTLFFEIARILTDKRPRYFLLENVKGLLSHQEGKTFQTILGVLSDLGYRVEWQILNSKHFGVPQNRERVFIIGHLGGEGGFQVFPIRESYEKYNESRQESNGRQNAFCLDANYYKGPDGKRTMIAITDSGLHRQKQIRTDILPPLRRVLDTVQLFDGQKIRSLTPIECERLQGFPDNWTEGISDTQRYKCLGNAVTTNVIAAVGNKFNE